MTGQSREIGEGTVIRMTGTRQLAVVPVLAAALGIFAAGGCGAGAQTADSDFTARPDARPPADADGGADADADGVVPVPSVEETCTLTGPPKVVPADTLVFEENFDGTTLDARRWTPYQGFRRSGILNYASSDQVKVEGGLLRISAVRSATPADPAYPYDAGFIDSLGKWARTYGRIEFRARFPFAGGVWYAIWGRPWTQSFPEIDIEVINRPGDATGQLYFVHHWAGEPLPADLRRAYVMRQNADWSQWHTYTIDWKPDAISWAVDGAVAMKATGEHVPKLPVYWMINGWVGGWPGNPTDKTPFPTTFEVDYMRVWRTGGVLADPAIRLAATPKSSYERKEWINVGIANFDEACAHVELRDGNLVVWSTSTAPYRVPMAVLAAGKHTLKIVATDGVRTAESAEFDVTVK